MPAKPLIARATFLPAILFAATAHAAPWTLTEITRDYEFPVISVPYVAWTAGHQIFLYNIKTKATTQITKEPDGASEPTIDGHHLAYRTKHGLMLYDIKKDAHTPIPDSGPDPARPDSPGYNPKLRGNHVAFIKLGVNGMLNAEVFLFDIATGKTTQISTDGGTKFQLTASERYVVWQYNSPGDPKNPNPRSQTIHAYDTATRESIDVSGTENTCDGWPKVAGDSVVFLRRNLKQTKVEGIFLFDINKKTRKKINTVYGEFFDTDGDSVVWSGSPADGLPVAQALRNPTPDQVYQYDIAKGSTKQLTNTPYSSNGARIDGKIMVWATTDKNQLVAFDGKTVEPFVRPLDNPPGTLVNASGGVWSTQIDKGVLLFNAPFKDPAKRGPAMRLYIAQQHVDEKQQ